MYSYHKYSSKIFSVLLLSLFWFSSSHLFADPKPPDKSYFEFNQGIYVEGIGAGGAQGAVQNVSFNLFGKGYVKVNVTDLAGDLEVAKISEGLSHTVSGNYHAFAGTGDISFNASNISFKMAVSGGQNSKINQLLLVGAGYVVTRGDNGFTIKETDTHILPKITHGPEIVEVRSETINLKLTSDLPAQATVYIKNAGVEEESSLVIPGNYFNHDILLEDLDPSTAYEFRVKLDFLVNGTNVESEPFQENTDIVNLHPSNKGEAKGFYYVNKSTNSDGGDEWFFVSPHGNAFFFLGVNSPSPLLTYQGSIIKKYGKYKTWADELGKEMASWNFHAAGRVVLRDYTYQDLTSSPVVVEAPYFIKGGNHNPPGGADFKEEEKDDIFPNPWDERYITRVKEQSVDYVDYLKKRNVVFVALVNEVHVYARQYEEYPFLDYRFQWAERLIDKPEEDTAKQEYIKSIRAYHNDSIESFNNARTSPDPSEGYTFDPVDTWDEVAEKSFIELYGPNALLYASDEMKRELMEFTSDFFKQWATVAISALRNEAQYQGPIMLASHPRAIPPEICEVYNELEDDNLVIGISYYTDEPRQEDLQEYYNLAQRPIVAVEFTFHAEEEGRNNIFYPFVSKYADRGPAYENYVLKVAQIPFVPGAMFYSITDHNQILDTVPGIDSSYENWGIKMNVSLENYTDLVEAATLANEKIYVEGTDLRQTFGFKPMGKNQQQMDTRSHPGLKFMKLPKDK